MSDETAADGSAEKNKAPTADPEIQSVSLGRMPLSEFSSYFKSVWDQVADKRFMARGYVTFDTTIAGTQFSVRTLRRCEESALALWSPSMAVESDPRFSSEDRHVAHGDAVARQMASSLRRLAVHLDGGVFLDNRVELPKLTTDTAASWLSSPAVINLLASLDNLDAGLIAALMDVAYDVELARACALRENIRNPSKTPTPTTSRRP